MYVGFEVGGSSGDGVGAWESSNVAHDVVHGIADSYTSSGSGTTYVHLT